MKNLSVFVFVAVLGYVSAAWIDQEQQRYDEERLRGNMVNLVGSNQHLHFPKTYPNFTRKFVLQYPYTENLELGGGYSENDAEIIPVKASPQLILAILEESKRMAAEKAVKQSTNYIKSGILRSEDYWNDVYVDDVDPEKVLRQAKEPREEPKHKILNVVPGTELYRVINKLRKTSPKLIYVINNK